MECIFPNDYNQVKNGWNIGKMSFLKHKLDKTLQNETHKYFYLSILYIFAGLIRKYWNVVLLLFNSIRMS